MNKDFIKTLISFLICVTVAFSLAGLSRINNNKNILMLLSFLAAAVSMFPLFLTIIKFNFFSNLEQPLKTKPRHLSVKDSLFLIIPIMLIAGITFPFFNRLGRGIIPLQNNLIILLTGHGFILWIGFIAAISFILHYFWYKKAKKHSGWKLSDIGLDESIDTGNIIRAVIAAITLTLTTTLIIFISMQIFQPGVNTIKSFFKPLNLKTIIELVLYFIIFLTFFSINAGTILYGQLRLPEKEINGKKSGLYTHLIWWGYSIVTMAAGLLIIYLIDLFIPSMMISSLLRITPWFVVFFFMATWFYRKSGTIYIGSIVLAIIATWLIQRGVLF